MDDIQFARSVSEKIGTLYQNAKTFSGQTPALCLTYLRGLAYAVCDSLDRGAGPDVFLATRIKNLESVGILGAPAIRHLRLLLRHGNVVAHPEAFSHEDHDFGAMAADGLDAARALLERITLLRGDPVPAYSIASVEDSGLRDLCYQAMVAGELEAIHQVALYFKAQADQLSAGGVGVINNDGYSLDAAAQIEQAMFWFKRGAELKDPDCMFQYGAYRFYTRGVAEHQLAQARSYLWRAADARHPEAMALIADCCIEGAKGFDRDVDYARELYEQAAEHNHPRALAQLGAIYAEGVGCDVDLERAARYSIRSAEAGFPQGQFNLYLHYSQGVGVEADSAKALAWLEAAAAQDYPAAIYDLAQWIRQGSLPGRHLSEVPSLYHRLANSVQYRARGALNLAEVTLELDDTAEGWMNAASFAQRCYELLVEEGDPYELTERCLAVAKVAIGKVRRHIEAYGPDPQKALNDVLLCTLFDKDGRPAANYLERLDEGRRLLFGDGAGAPQDPERKTQALLRAACISTPAKRQKSVADRPRSPALGTSPRVGRNDPCPCGSGLKFKKCHGH